MITFPSIVIVYDKLVLQHSHWQTLAYIQSVLTKT